MNGKPMGLSGWGVLNELAREETSSLVYERMNDDDRKSQLASFDNHNTQPLIIMNLVSPNESRTPTLV